MSLPPFYRAAQLLLSFGFKPVSLQSPRGPQPSPTWHPQQRHSHPLLNCTLPPSSGRSTGGLCHRLFRTPFPVDLPPAGPGTQALSLPFDCWDLRVSSWVAREPLCPEGRSSLGTTQLGHLPRVDPALEIRTSFAPPNSVSGVRVSAPYLDIQAFDYLFLPPFPVSTQASLNWN